MFLLDCPFKKIQGCATRMSVTGRCYPITSHLHGEWLVCVHQSEGREAQGWGKAGRAGSNKWWPGFKSPPAALLDPKHRRVEQAAGAALPPGSPAEEEE